MNELRTAYLDAMGIPVWLLRRGAADEADLVSNAAATAEPDTDDSASVWRTLAESVASCTACPLHRTRKQTVFGVGNRSANLLVIGEAPGADEDRQGEPFVGRAGQLLNAMLRAVHLARDDVYIANI